MRERLLDYEGIYKKAEVHMREEVKKLPKTLYYHDERHPFQVAEIAGKLASANKNLGARDISLIRIAALLHEKGLVYMGEKQGHEKMSAMLAVSFLRKLRLPESDIDAVRAAILDSEMKEHDDTYRQSPQSLYGKYLCDADTANFGQNNFFELNEAHRREEIEHYKKKYFTKRQNLARVLPILAAHKWHTAEAGGLFEMKKQENIRLVKEKLKSRSIIL